MFKRPVDKPWFLIQETYSQLYVSSLQADDPHFTQNRNDAYRWLDLKEVQAAQQALELMHDNPHDKFEIITCFRIKARAK